MMPFSFETFTCVRKTFIPLLIGQKGLFWKEGKLFWKKNLKSLLFLNQATFGSKKLSKCLSLERKKEGRMKDRPQMGTALERERKTEKSSKLKKIRKEFSTKFIELVNKNEKKMWCTFKKQANF